MILPSTDGGDYYQKGEFINERTKEIRGNQILSRSSGTKQTAGCPYSRFDELIELRKRVKEQDKEIRRLKEENEFLEEASAFFAASRRKSAKNRD